MTPMALSLPLPGAHRHVLATNIGEGTGQGEGNRALPPGTGRGGGGGGGSPLKEGVVGVGGTRLHLVGRKVPPLCPNTGFCGTIGFAFQSNRDRGL